MIKILKSEFYKTKHTWLPWIHLILPIIYAFSFFAAAKVTTLKNFSDSDIIKNYLVILGAVFPIIIGAITSKVVDMEVIAGHFQVMLSSTKSRVKAYVGKCLVLLIGALFSTVLAISIFAILFGQQRLLEWLIDILMIFVGCLSVYLIHLWVSIIFGGGASLGLGFVETLLALLSITSIGDRIWYYIPSTWSSRLSATYVVGSKTIGIAYMNNELFKWSCIAIPIMVILLIGSLIWFSRWDGKSFSD